MSMRKFRVTIIITILAGVAVLPAGDVHADPVGAVLAPVKRVTAAGTTATVTATVSGLVQEFGAPGGQEYHLRLVESDDVADDRLEVIRGKYPLPFVPAGTAVDFLIEFKLHCNATATKLWGVGVNFLKLQIDGGGFVAQTELVGAGDTDLLDPPPPGQFDVENYVDSDETREWEPRMEFFLSLKNHGDHTRECIVNGGGTVELL
jgi:hypothetical protein